MTHQTIKSLVADSVFDVVVSQIWSICLTGFEITGFYSIKMLAITGWTYRWSSRRLPWSRDGRADVFWPLERGRPCRTSADPPHSQLESLFHSRTQQNCGGTCSGASVAPCTVNKGISLRLYSQYFHISTGCLRCGHSNSGCQCVNIPPNIHAAMLSPPFQLVFLYKQRYY